MHPTLFRLAARRVRPRASSLSSRRTPRDSTSRRSATPHSIMSKTTGSDRRRAVAGCLCATIGGTF
eukprot:5205183-Prymnesium_polylepis.1